MIFRISLTFDYNSPIFVYDIPKEYAKLHRPVIHPQVVGEL